MSGGKPRMCEVLGVEVGQGFSYNGVKFYVNKNGAILYRGEHSGPLSNIILDMINHPEFIYREPLLTPDELATARLLAKAGVKRISRATDDKFYYADSTWPPCESKALGLLFPSVVEGMRLDLTELELEEEG